MSARTDLTSPVFISTREAIIRPPQLEKQLRLEDRFVINHKICDGSVSSVYLARDELTGSKVAIKVANMNCSSSVARLIHEKRICDSLDDVSHTTKCFGLHRAEIGHIPIMFLAKEYSSSGSLLDWLIKYNGDHEYRIKYGVGVFEKCAKAASSLNNQGCTCNDLCPANFVKIGKEWKIADFGLAASSGKQIACNVGPGMWGTPIYMSPEAFDVDSFDELDVRSDVYSMSVILYQMLSPDTSPPFYAESSDQLRQLHCHRRADKLTCIDSYLAEIIAKGLSKDTADRYESIKYMLHDIELKDKKKTPQQTSEEYFELGHFDYEKKNYSKAEINLRRVTAEGEGYGSALTLLENIKLRHSDVCELIPDILRVMENQHDLSGARDLYHQCNAIYPYHPALRPVKAKLNVKYIKVNRLLESFSCSLYALNIREAERCFAKLTEIDSDSTQTSEARRIMDEIEDILDEMNSKMNIAEKAHDNSQLLLIRDEYSQNIKSLVGGKNVKQLATNIKLLP